MFRLWYIYLYIWCSLSVLADAPPLPSTSCVVTGQVIGNQIFLTGVSNVPKKDANIFWEKVGRNGTSENILGTLSNKYNKTKGRYEQYKEATTEGKETFVLIISDVTEEDFTMYKFQYGACKTNVSLSLEESEKLATTPATGTNEQTSGLEPLAVVGIVAGVLFVTAVVAILVDVKCNQRRVINWLMKKFSRGDCGRNADDMGLSNIRRKSEESGTEEEKESVISRNKEDEKNAYIGNIPQGENEDQNVGSGTVQVHNRHNMLIVQPSENNAPVSRTQDDGDSIEPHEEDMDRVFLGRNGTIPINKMPDTDGHL